MRAGGLGYAKARRWPRRKIPNNPRLPIHLPVPWVYVLVLDHCEVNRE